MKHNRIIALILLAFVIWWGFLTTRLPETTMIGEPGPKFFPSVILLLMAVFSVILFFIKDEKKQETPELIMEDGEKIEIEEEETHPMKSALKLFAVFLAGIILVYFVGFSIGMIICLTVMLWMIGWKIFPRAFLFSASVTLIVYFLFDWLMRIPLPAGRLF
jgi:putative tricarboxylic transport membrane protein